MGFRCLWAYSILVVDLILTPTLHDWNISLCRSHPGPLCRRDDVHKMFYQESLPLQFPDSQVLTDTFSDLSGLSLLS
jgi:hypothetical protein